MSVSPEEFNAPATKGDVAGVAVTVGLALIQINSALLALKVGTPEVIDEAILKISVQSDKLSKQFDELVGWQAE